VRADDEEGLTRWLLADVGKKKKETGAGSGALRRRGGNSRVTQHVGLEVPPALACAGEVTQVGGPVRKETQAHGPHKGARPKE
jgi:hypothetical protein